MSDWRISELRCRAGWLGIAPVPGRSGSYEADLTALMLWEPSLVLSMTTTAELASAGAGGLGEDLAALGIHWRHLPVPDLGAPPDETAALWPAAAAQAHDLLGKGGRVLAHCFGGCGRSGMALLRLMVEAGENADPALARLRDARPCAVETEAQRAWAARPMFERLGWTQR